MGDGEGGPAGWPSRAGSGDARSNPSTGDPRHGAGRRRSTHRHASIGERLDFRRETGVTVRRAATNHGTSDDLAVNAKIPKTNPSDRSAPVERSLNSQSGQAWSGQFGRNWRSILRRATMFERAPPQGQAVPRLAGPQPGGAAARASVRQGTIGTAGELGSNPTTPGSIATGSIATGSSAAGDLPPSTGAMDSTKRGYNQRTMGKAP